MLFGRAPDSSVAIARPTRRRSHIGACWTGRSPAARDAGFLRSVAQERDAARERSLRKDVRHHGRVDRVLDGGSAYSQSAVRQKTLIKIVVGAVAIGVLGVLFVRSALNVTAEPYRINRADLSRWTVALDPAPSVSGVWLSLRPPDQMAPPLFSQIFKRSGQSLSGPDPVSMPLLLKGEFDGAVVGHFSAESLLALAKSGSLESLQPKPLCLASRRVSQPGSTREVYFVRFDHPAVGEFRRQLAERLATAGVASFDPLAVSPVIIVAATDAGFSSWLPLQGTPTDDCLAPIDVG